MCVVSVCVILCSSGVCVRGSVCGECVCDTM